jgi:cytochrome c oxidase subunit 2
MKEFLDQWMPVGASEHAARVDSLNVAVHWLMLLLFIGWGLYFLYVLRRFSARNNPRANYHGTRSHFSTYTEAGVAVIEVVLLLGFSIPIWYEWAHKPAAAKNALELRVVAEQFAWNVHYPGKDGIFGRTAAKFVTPANPLGIDPSDPKGKDDVASLNQLHIELNRPVIVHVSSKDVIHSFKLPVMRSEQDAIPGMDIPIHFTPILANDDGTKWEIACAQLCGLGHYRMRGQLFVHSHQEFQKWLATTPKFGAGGS